MIFITKQSKIAEIGSHSIHKIEDTSMVYLPNQSVRTTHPDESRLVMLFFNGLISIPVIKGTLVNMSFDLARDTGIGCGLGNYRIVTM